MTRRRLRLVHLGLVLTLALAGAPSTFGQTQRAANREWRSYAGDPGGLRYSALDQINRDNVKDLEVAFAATQDDRDFVFTDDEGHLVLRFAGAEPHGLDADQIEEIVNVQLSTMVHDRLRADARFEAEPVDAEWAESMKPRIERHVRGSSRPIRKVSTPSS